MDIEAVVLTGGASRRMGQDKANLPVEGEPMAERIVRLLLVAGVPVTVLGRNPIEGAEFVPDSEEYAGPLAAISSFRPSREYVFVASCDLPLFDARVVGILQSHIGTADAAIPLSEDRLQPLCALYRSKCFALAAKNYPDGNRRIFGWLVQLDVVEVAAYVFETADIDPRSVQGVNTREEYTAATTVADAAINHQRPP